MKTYFDLEPKERAALSEQNVQSMLDVQLMSEGVLKPQPPKLTPVITPADIGKRSCYYGVNGKGKYGSDEDCRVVFDSTEKAAAFMALNPMVIDYNYEIGTDYRYAMAISDAKITVQGVLRFEDVQRMMSELKKNKAAADENQKLQRDYQEACRAVEKITNSVWEDWFKQKAQMDRCAEVVRTFESYLVLTNDNAEMALTFLEKAYKPEMLDLTREWILGKLPDHAAPPAAEVAA